MTTLPSDLDGTRERAEGYMRARCTIVRPSGEAPVLDPATWQLTPEDGERVYPAPEDDDVDGICSVQDGPGIGTAMRIEGGEDTAVRSWVLRLPFGASASHDVRRGDVVTVTDSDNPQLVGHPLIVHAPDLRGRQVTVMLTLTERSYEAAS